MDRPGRDFLHEGVHDESDAQQDERDGQELAHVQGHGLLERHLRLLDELDEEAGAEAHRQEDAHEHAPVHLVQFLPVQADEREAQQEIGEPFIELGRMLGFSLSAKFENEAPGKVRHVTVNL